MKVRRSRVSVLNPPHPLFTTGAKRSKYFAECCTPGELASPYPSTGLRESAVPPRCEEFFCDLNNFFCFWPPKSPPWPLLGSVRRLQHRSWAFLARFFTKHRSERAPKSNFKRSWLDFELILVPQTADFHYFFIRFPWTALTFSKKTPPTKNLRKP